VSLLCLFDSLIQLLKPTIYIFIDWANAQPGPSLAYMLLFLNLNLKTTVIARLLLIDFTDIMMTKEYDQF